MSHDVVVVGAGLAGLAAARDLARRRRRRARARGARPRRRPGRAGHPRRRPARAARRRGGRQRAHRLPAAGRRARPHAGAELRRRAGRADLVLHEGIHVGDSPTLVRARPTTPAWRRSTTEFAAARRHRRPRRPLVAPGRRPPRPTSSMPQWLVDDRRHRPTCAARWRRGSSALSSGSLRAHVAAGPAAQVRDHAEPRRSTPTTSGRTCASPRGRRRSRCGWPTSSADRIRLGAPVRTLKVERRRLRGAARVRRARLRPPPWSAPSRPGRCATSTSRASPTPGSSRCTGSGTRSRRSSWRRTSGRSGATPARTG